MGKANPLLVVGPRTAAWRNEPTLDGPHVYTFSLDGQIVVAQRIVHGLLCIWKRCLKQVLRRS